MQKHLVVIPTYNERENIEALVPQILALGPHVSVLVVDDSSPDGTAQVVQGLGSVHGPRVSLLLRPGKQGLAKAYLAGFQWALERDFDFVLEMDADFSHRVVDLDRLLKVSPSQMVVVGSRYVKGGGTANWGWFRKLISVGGSMYARWILGYPLRDWTGGFARWHRDALNRLGLERVKSDGYSFQIEMKYRALRAGLQVQEVPILFEERRVGQSKMSARIFFEALFRVWAIRRQA